MRLLTLLTSCLVVLAGCASREVADVPRVTDAASKRVEKAGSRFAEVDLEVLSVELPKEWVVADLTRKDFDAMMEEVAAENEGIKQSLLSVRRAAQSGVFLLFAFDVESTSHGFTDNLNIVRRPVPKGATFAELREGTERHLSTVAEAKISSTETVKIGERDWFFADWTMQMRAANQTIVLQILTYSTLKDDHEVALTFTANQSTADEMRAHAKDVMQSLQFK